MKNTLNTIQTALEQLFGFSDTVRVVEGGLSHEVYSLDDSKVIAKVYSSDISANRLEAEQKALAILESSILVSAPKLIRSKRGNYREQINSNFLSCYRKIEGERKFLLTEAPKELNQIAEIGSYLGKLHRELFLGSGALTPRISPILEVARSIEKKPEEIDQIVSELIQSQAPYFITHGDFQQSNLVYVGEAISGIIDFEYSTPDFRIADIAGCLSNLLSANSDFLPTDKVIEIFTRSYDTASNLPLSEFEKQSLKGLIKVIWKVNLFWAESKLETIESKNSRALIEFYRNQTANCISS